MTGNKLTIPDLTETYIDIRFLEDNAVTDAVEGTVFLPFARTTISRTEILSGKLLTNGEDVKAKYQILLKTPESWKYNPGDTVGILTHNDISEVDKVITCLGLHDQAQKPCTIIGNEKSGKRKLPYFSNKVTNIKNILLHNVDFRCVPKKLLIRSMAEYSTDQDEKDRLLFLCSKEGSLKYTESVLLKKQTFIKLLLSCPSCQIPITSLIQQLPQLTPRSYSIASSHLQSPQQLALLFSVEICDDTTGLCSGMLVEKLKRLVDTTGKNSDSFVSLYLRHSLMLRFPGDFKINVIMIALGTGLAPFLGYLRHRSCTEAADSGDIVLYYGCRYKNRDYLYKEELEESKVLTKLYLSFSRESGGVKYVQDNIKLNCAEICDYILRKDSVICYCGSVQGGKSVLETIKQVIIQHEGVSPDDAENLVKNLQASGKYLQEIWN